MTLADGEPVRARRLLIATGAVDELPPIPGLRERWAKDFLHCPYCHGWEVRDQPLGVLGTSAGSVEHAQLIRQWSDDLIFFTHTHALTEVEREQLEARGIHVVDGEVRGLVVEDDRLRGLVLGDGRTVERTALFHPARDPPPPGRPPGTPRLRGQRPRLRPRGHRWKDKRLGRLGSRERLEPAGTSDHRGGEGSAAVISINADLVEEDARDALQAVSKERQHRSEMELK